jgi:glycosyltransferase involved in cell wall biosynthesis
MKVVVTIPAYNEEDTIKSVVDGVKKSMNKAGYPFEVLVIDDGSKDRTGELSKKAGAILVSNPYNYGLAETFRTGIKKALEMDADIIVNIDADGQYKVEEIPKLLSPIIKDEADLVLGSRFLGTIEEMPIIKRWGNIAFSRSISQITKLKISDGQTGFRAFTKELAEGVEIKSKHTYTQEMIIRAVRERFRVVEIPIYFAKRASGSSRLISNPFEYAIKSWTTIFRVYRDYEPLKFYGSIGMILILMSLMLGVYVLGVFLTQGFLGTYQKIPTILLTVLLFVSGLQILLFGFLADKIDELS